MKNNLNIAWNSPETESMAGLTQYKPRVISVDSPALTIHSDLLSCSSTTSRHVTELQSRVPSLVLRAGRKFPHFKVCPTCFSQMTFKHVQRQSTRGNHATGSIPLLHLARLSITVTILLTITRSESQKQAFRTQHLSWRAFLVLLHRILNLQLHCHSILQTNKQNLKAEICPIQMGQAEMLGLSSHTVFYWLSQVLDGKRRERGKCNHKTATIFHVGNSKKCVFFTSDQLGKRWSTEHAVLLSTRGPRAF